MLRVAAFEVPAVRQYVPIVRLDENIGVREGGIVDPGGKVSERGESPLQGVLDHSAEAQDLGQRVSFDDAPGTARRLEPVEDRAIGEPVALDQGGRRPGERGAVVQTPGGGSGGEDAMG